MDCIYVSRGDAATRRVTNEAELDPVLRARGFRCCSGSSLTSDSAMAPAGATRMSRLTDITADNNANCVALNCTLHILIRNARNPAVTSPVQ